MGRSNPPDLPSEVLGVSQASEQNSEPEVHPFADEPDPLESAYAFAIGEAAKAGQWAVITTIVNELQARREWKSERERAENEERGGTVLPFRPKA